MRPFGPSGSFWRAGRSCLGRLTALHPEDLPRGRPCKRRAQSYIFAPAKARQQQVQRQQQQQQQTADRSQQQQQQQPSRAMLIPRVHLMFSASLSSALADCTNINHQPMYKVALAAQTSTTLFVEQHCLSSGHVPTHIVNISSILNIKHHPQSHSTRDAIVLSVIYAPSGSFAEQCNESWCVTGSHFFTGSAASVGANSATQQGRAARAAWLSWPLVYWVTLLV